eukprot:793984_1
MAMEFGESLYRPGRIRSESFTKLADWSTGQSFSTPISETTGSFASGASSVGAAGASRVAAESVLLTTTGLDGAKADVLEAMTAARRTAENFIVYMEFTDGPGEV